MGKVIVRNLKAIEPDSILLSDVKTGEAIEIDPNTNYDNLNHKLTPEPGVYIKTRVIARGFNIERPNDFGAFLNIATGVTKMFPLWIYAKSVELRVHYSRVK